MAWYLGCFVTLSNKDWQGSPSCFKNKCWHLASLPRTNDQLSRIVFALLTVMSNEFCRIQVIWSDILCCLSYTDLTTYEDSFAEFLRLDAVVKNASEAGRMMSSQPQVKFNTSRERSKFSTSQSLDTVVGTFCRARRKHRWQCILVFSNLLSHISIASLHVSTFSLVSGQLYYILKLLTVKWENFLIS